VDADGDALPTVSVVVPVYNGAHTVAACVESLLEQTEGQAGKEQESEPRRARRGGVDIEF